MTFEEARQHLQDLHSEVCLTIAKGESYWMGMASDYQTTYAGTRDYDKSFKRRYYADAEGCRLLAERVRKLPLPSKPEEIGPFVENVKDNAKRCSTWTLEGRIERLVKNMEQIASQFQ